MQDSLKAVFQYQSNLFPGINFQLFVNMVDVGLEGAVLNKEGSADFFVAFSGKDVFEDIFFFERELVEAVLEGGFFFDFFGLELVH